MIFSWLKQRRRQRILAEPFPSEWLAILERNLPQFALLTPLEQQKLRDDLRVFVAEKNWEGCAGLVLTDEIKVTVAAYACLMSLGLPDDPWHRVLSILIYPTAYVVPAEDWEGGLTLAGESAHLGEAHYLGPVILSWADLLRDIAHASAGRNLVWHEFAHQLDMLDRSVDGTPPLADAAQGRRWHAVMTAEYEALIAAAETGQATLLDTYGAEDEGEFFAVASECFFAAPQALAARHAKLYEVLRDYYRQDPARREGG